MREVKFAHNIFSVNLASNNAQAVAVEAEPYIQCYICTDTGRFSAEFRIPLIRINYNIVCHNTNQIALTLHM